VRDPASKSCRTGALATALIAGVLLFAAGSARAEGPGWATAQAAELSRQGAAHAAGGRAEEATQRFLEAIRFDATYGPAYLGLGALHERAGDPREAERIYTMGIDHVTGFAAGHRARAALRLRHRRLREAIEDLEAAAALSPDDAAPLQELAGAYVAAGALPAALGVTRRLEALAAARGDSALRGEAHTRARALSLLIDAADPVRAGLYDRGPVRRAIALHAAGSSSSPRSSRARTRSGR
jgi:tetratricopeptide (TPR) repeat protein